MLLSNFCFWNTELDNFCVHHTFKTMFYLFIRIQIWKLPCTRYFSRILNEGVSTPGFKQCLEFTHLLLKVIYFPPVDLNQAQGETFIAMQYLCLWIQNTWLISTLPKIWSGFAQTLIVNTSTGPNLKFSQNMRPVRFHRVFRQPQENSRDFVEEFPITFTVCQL